MRLTPEQLQLVEAPLDTRIFLEGPAGAGKTTAAVERMLRLMAHGVSGDQILLLLPQRTLASPYQAALRTPGVVSGGLILPQTLPGLAQRMVALYWPVIAEAAGFAAPDLPPTFLTLETAQYYMAYLVRPLIEQRGYFQTVSIQRNRLYSQILDGLNKCALGGFPLQDIGPRLKAAWLGDPAQLRVYDDVQACAERFRQYCLENNLLDFSLQFEIFINHLWLLPECRSLLQQAYRHLIYDNSEEDPQPVHDLVFAWLPEFASALVVYDHGAGYRRFLGANPESAERLRQACPLNAVLETPLQASPAILALAAGLEQVLPPYPENFPPGKRRLDPALHQALVVGSEKYYPGMLDWVTSQVQSLVDEQGVAPAEIVILAPFVSDSLQFSLRHRLDQAGIPYRSHRPSRSLRDEAVTRAALTLCALAHPQWEQYPERQDVIHAMTTVLGGLDLVRAQLLGEAVYRKEGGVWTLHAFDAIAPRQQARITFAAGLNYERLRAWLVEYTQRAEQPLDHFLSALFGEVLSQPGFGLHDDDTAGEIFANLIESVQKFRWAVGERLAAEGVSAGGEYLRMVAEGLVAAQYLRSWGESPQDGVLIAPAYTFLMNNRPVDYQFWLDVGSQGWFERLNQPLTHPYVLSRDWPQGRVWSFDDELRASQAGLRRLALGLARRCRRAIYLCSSQLGEQGYEQRSPLLNAFQRVLQAARET